MTDISSIGSKQFSLLWLVELTAYGMHLASTYSAQTYMYLYPLQSVVRYMSLWAKAC